MGHRDVTVRGQAGGLSQGIEIGVHRLLSDEPEDAGGTGRGPDPYQLLLAALGACTSMTLRIYADMKKWPLKEVEVKLRHDKIYALDCHDCETKEGKIDRIEREIRLEGDLTEEQRERLLQIANRCPVHRTLSSEIHIESRLV